MKRSWINGLAALLLVAVVIPQAAHASAQPGGAADRPTDGRPQPDDLAPAEATPAAGARGALLGKPSASTAAERSTWLIRLVDPAVPSYEGDRPGLEPTAPRQGQALDPDSRPSQEYRQHLEAEQAEFVHRMERTVGREVEVPFTYQFAVNGMAAVLTADEAAQLAADPAVASIAPDQVRELHTDVGPQWAGADALWNAVAELGLPGDIKGEGVVIGTIDTGISPGNASFADVGGDGYDHTNPLGAGEYVGVCDPTNPAAAGGFDPAFPCNDKLIGAYNFIGNTGTSSALDYDGHGSHTASTSGGNVVDDVVVEAPTITTAPFDISGVAPHANVISYRGCCTLSGLTASINQAIADGVDVINYSIGSSSPSQAWDDFDAVGFMNARAAGIFVATSNGNDGPFDATTGSPADVPWITSVGASTHNRHNRNALTGLTNAQATVLPDIEGKSVTGPLTTAAPIVSAADVADPFCEDDTGHAAAFTGRIVICERGVNGRVEKSENVAAQGAVGFVLTNDEPHGDSLQGDEYALPGVFISYDDGQALNTWLATGTGHEATIAGTTFQLDDARGDLMASFSSRGPNQAMDVIVPSVTAPGVDILAALGIDSYSADVHGFISGTSMASPHVAGLGALLTQARPGWTPAQMQSALMTTARNTVLNHDGELATPYAQGSGHVDVGAAVRAGLLFDETTDDYAAANPAVGGDPKTLNVPSFANGQCLVTCTWERLATVPDDADAPVPDDVTWTVSTTTFPGLELDVALSTATVSPGESMGITVTADVGAGVEGETIFGWITLTPDADVPVITMPVAVVPSAGVLPDAVEVETRRNAGSEPVSDLQSIAITDFTASVAGMVKATLQESTLVEDPTNDDPYDDLAQVDVFTVEVPAGSTRLVAETIEYEMPDLDLFVGTGDTPSLATEVCASTSGTADEQCDVPDPAPGTWWILIESWEGTTPDAADAYTLASAVVPGTDAGNAGIDGPLGPLPVGEPYDVRFHWDIPEMVPGDRWYGTAVLGSSPANPDDIGSFPLTLLRADDDVTKTASTDTAAPGNTFSYDLTVQPNLTPEDLVYTIEDSVPDGLVIDEASVTGGGTVEGQTITWEVGVPSPAGQVADYVLSTPETSAQCADWSGFLDVSGVAPLTPELDGDSVAVDAFGNLGPFNHYGQDLPNLTVGEDGLATVAGGYDGTPWVPQTIPAVAQPNGVMAPLWSDLETSVADGSGVRLAQSEALGAAVIQWEDAFEYTDDGTIGPSVGTFQAWIYNTVDPTRPEMTFDYETLGALPGLATIGIERILGDRATAALNAGDPSSLLEDGGSFCLDYAGPAAEPITLSYDVTVSDVAPEGVLTNSAAHSTDDPYAQAVVASDDVLILGADCTEPPFTDVPITNPFCGEIAWMASTGISEGYDDGTYRPTRTVSRQAMSAFMARLADAPLAPCTTAPFTDVPITNPFCPEITWMADTGISEGYDDGTYRPGRTVSRQAMSAFMYRLAHLP